MGRRIHLLFYCGADLGMQCDGGMAASPSDDIEDHRHFPEEFLSDWHADASDKYRRQSLFKAMLFFSDPGHLSGRILRCSSVFHNSEEWSVPWRKQPSEAERRKRGAEQTDLQTTPIIGATCESIHRKSFLLLSAGASISVSHELSGD